VGVAADVHHRGLDDSETMQLYVPTRRWFFADNFVAVVVRTEGDPSRVLRGLHQAVLAPDPGAVVTQVATMSDVRSQSTAQRSLSLTLFGAFAAIALLLAAAGVFGALAGAVAERMREIGLRVALGATPRDIVRLVVASGFGLTGGGVAIGLAGALATARLIRAILFGVGPTDLVTLLGVTLLVGLAAIAASLVPAWRAVRIDPITVLRSE
jgi:putative ABC transport system permease protein